MIYIYMHIYIHVHIYLSPSNVSDQVMNRSVSWCMCRGKKC